MMNGDYINNNNNNTTSNNNNVNYVMDSNMSTATTTAMVIDPSILVTSNQLEKRHAQNIDINLTLDEKLMNYMVRFIFLIYILPSIKSFILRDQNFFSDFVFSVRFRSRRSQKMKKNFFRKIFTNIGSKGGPFG